MQPPGSGSSWVHLQILTTRPLPQGIPSGRHWPRPAPRQGAAPTTTTQPLSFGPSATPGPAANAAPGPRGPPGCRGPDQGIGRVRAGHRQWEGAGAGRPFRLRFLGVPPGGGVGLGGPCTSRRRGVGEREGVRAPGRRFQESPAALPKRPGREGTRRAHELGDSGWGSEGGRTLGPLAPPRPAPGKTACPAHVGTSPCAAGGPYTGDSSEPPFPPL